MAAAPLTLISRSVTAYIVTGNISLARRAAVRELGWKSIGTTGMEYQTSRGRRVRIVTRIAQMGEIPRGTPFYGVIARQHIPLTDRWAIDRMMKERILIFMEPER